MAFLAGLAVSNCWAGETIEKSHSACRQHLELVLAATDPVVDAKNDPCEGYLERSGHIRSPSHLVLANLYMAELDIALAKVKGRTRERGPHLRKSRRRDFVLEAEAAVRDLQLQDQWFIPEFLTRTTFASWEGGSGLVKSAYSVMTERGLRDGAYWAALMADATVSLLDPGSPQLPRDQIMSSYPRALGWLRELPAGAYRSQRLTRAYIGQSKLLFRSDPIRAFDVLLAANLAANFGAPELLEQTQLAVLRLFIEHRDVIGAGRRREIVGMISDSKIHRYKDSLVNLLLEASRNCPEFLEAYGLAEKYRSDSNVIIGLASEIRIGRHYGDDETAERMVQGALCLSDNQLHYENSGRVLEAALDYGFPPNGADGVPSSVSELRARLQRTR